VPAAPTLAEQKQIVLEHYEEMLSLYGEENGVRVARKHISWYSNGLHGSNEYRQQVNQQHSSAEVKEIMHRYYDGLMEMEQDRAVH
jgi:tRNA-dihydrouridine synthase B